MDDLPAKTMIDGTALPARQPAVGSQVERVVRHAVPTRADVGALMKRCQIGVGGRRALDDAHDIMADCYGTLGLLMLTVERMAAWMEAECYCPCCTGTRECADDCTFGDDDPNTAARIAAAREAMYGPNVRVEGPPEARSAGGNPQAQLAGGPSRTKGSTS